MPRRWPRRRRRRLSRVLWRWPRLLRRQPSGGRRCQPRRRRCPSGMPLRRVCLSRPQSRRLRSCGRPKYRWLWSWIRRLRSWPRRLRSQPSRGWGRCSSGCSGRSRSSWGASGQGVATLEGTLESNDAVRALRRYDSARRGKRSGAPHRGGRRGGRDGWEALGVVE